MFGILWILWLVMVLEYTYIFTMFFKRRIWSDSDMKKAFEAGQSTAIRAAYVVDIDKWLENYRSDKIL